MFRVLAAFGLVVVVAMLGALLVGGALLLVPVRFTRFLNDLRTMAEAVRGRYRHAEPMPHITVPADLPGITGLLAFKPALGRKFMEFTEELMRGPSSLSQGERELIAARVSTGNECRFCTNSHAAAAQHALADDGTLVAAVCADPASAPVTPRLRALLAIADQVRVSGRNVTSTEIAAARAAGASEEDLHDTVLVAAAFCLANRYVDGLDAITPDDARAYDQAGRRLAHDGYLALGRS